MPFLVGLDAFLVGYEKRLRGGPLVPRMPVCGLPALLFPASTLARSQRSSVGEALPSSAQERHASSSPYGLQASPSISYERAARLSPPPRRRDLRSSSRGRRLSSTTVSNVTELAQAVAAPSHDVIMVADGHYLLSAVLEVKFPLVIEAEHHGSVVLDGQGHDRVVKLDDYDISLIGLNITGGVNNGNVRRYRTL